MPSGLIMTQAPYAAIQKNEDQAQKYRDSLNIPEPLIHKTLITYALADPNSHQVNHQSGDSKHISSSSHHLRASDHAGVGLMGRL